MDPRVFEIGAQVLFGLAVLGAMVIIVLRAMRRDEEEDTVPDRVWMVVWHRPGEFHMESAMVARCTEGFYILATAFPSQPHTTVVRRCDVQSSEEDALIIEYGVTESAPGQNANERAADLAALERALNERGWFRAVDGGWEHPSKPRLGV